MIFLCFQDFFNWQLLCMPKHNKGENVLSKYMEEKLSYFQVYGYYKLIINVSIKYQ